MATLMDERIANEVANRGEAWAAREIERLRADLAEARKHLAAVLESSIAANDGLARPMKTLKLPPKFWIDHLDRCGDHPGIRNEVKRTAKAVIVELDDEALANLKDDAEYYTAPDGPDADWIGGLKASARATLRALSK